MKQTALKPIDRLNGQKGFTLIELIVVMTIISILAAMGIMYLGDFRYRAADSTALTEGRNLMTALSDAFLGDEDVYFGDGATELLGDIGTTSADESEPRNPVFTLSDDVRVILDGSNTSAPGDGWVTATIWHVNGSNFAGLTLNDANKKEYVFEISEATGQVSAPAF